MRRGDQAACGLVRSLACEAPPVGACADRNIISPLLSDLSRPV
jgi:hypothetical protein